MLILSLVLIISFVFYILFSKNPTLGKKLYAFNNWLEKKQANLSTFKNTDDKHTSSPILYSYLSNEQSQKPVMLMLHGFSADKDIWLKFAKLASQDFNVIIPDLLGHGDMPYDDQANYSAFEQAKYVCELLNHLPVNGELTIVGNSMGGMIAAIIADQSQGAQKDSAYALQTLNIAKVVLLDPAGAVSDYSKKTAKNNDNPFYLESFDEALAFFKKAMNKPPYFPPSVYAYFAKDEYLAKQEKYKHMFSNFFNIDEFFDTPFQHINAKVILVWGQMDGLLPVADAIKWQSLVNETPVILPGIGHMPMVECPKQTYQLMR